jgi:hypothetical protein
MKGIKGSLGALVLLVATTVVGVLPATPASALEASCNFRGSDLHVNIWYITEGNLLRGESCQVGDARLILHRDSGNLVLYDGNGNQRWQAGTYASGNLRAATRAEWQSDGNFVAYSDTGQVRFASNTWQACSGIGCVLAVQGDGNVVIYTNHNPRRVVWSRGWSNVG